MQARQQQRCNWKHPFPLSRSTAMANQPHLTSAHARAICDEIGARLGYMLRPDHNDLPPRLRNLVLRLGQIDDAAPSIIPSIEDMARPLVEPLVDAA